MQPSNLIYIVEICLYNTLVSRRYCAKQRLCGTFSSILTGMYLILNNNIILTLVKVESKHWDGLPYKESKVFDVLVQFDTTPDKVKDPQAGLMDLMKKMYEEGDDNMKRTIAETWSKSQNKTM